MSTTALLLLSIAVSLPQQSSNPLEQFLWKKRVILIVYSAEKTSLAEEQLALFRKYAIEIKDRELVMATMQGTNNGSIEDESLDASSISQLQKIYNPDGDDFLFLLIGKDGGVKLRKNDLVSPKSIFDLIDSMPMRQSEMRRNE